MVLGRGPAESGMNDARRKEIHRAVALIEVLTIKGEKQEEKEEEKQDYYVRERSFGSFERTFQVPDRVDIDKVDASFKKGVLTVTLPKTAEAQKAEKKITVKPE
jgi:HSP20 family protein